MVIDDEVEAMLKRVVMDYFELHFQYTHVGTNRNDENAQV
jgi:hypothetical protein